MKIFVFRDIRQINELIACKNSVSHQLQQQNNFLEFTMIIYVLVIGLSGVCNHTSDEKVGDRAAEVRFVYHVYTIID